MTRFLFLLGIFLLIAISSNSQERIWQLGLSSFFDNTEFGQSAFKQPQTMSGVILSPLISARWDSVHSVTGGLDVLREFGSSREIDDFFLTAYYTYDKRPFKFIMGNFPRGLALEKYPRLFFQDSVQLYRPNLNGMVFEYSNDRLLANAWMDWTGRKSPEVNEAFLLGFSGKYNTGIFYLQSFTWLMHFASRLDPVVPESLHDNGLFLISAGIDLSGKTKFDRLEINSGWVMGLERSRSEHTGWIKQHGLLSEFRLEIYGAGLFNSFYTGDGQMYFYNKHAHKLYWGDPIYRAGRYNRTDFFLRIINNRYIHANIVYSLHFAEKRMYHEQLLRLSVSYE